MSARAEARIVSRLVRWGLLLAFAVQIGSTLLSSEPTLAQASQLDQGRQLYQVNCSSCHGIDASGTKNDGPSLQGAGPAAVDFMLTSGRMPLGDPNDQPTRQPPKFSSAEIDALVAYVGSIAPDGPAIPVVDASGGDLANGMQLFVNTCASCHGASATGNSVGGGQIAPSLYPPGPTQIGEAVRIGPGVMPKFGTQTLSDADVNSIARYLLSLRNNDTGSFRGGLQLGRIGALAEGFIAIVFGLGLLVLVLRLAGAKS